MNPEPQSEIVVVIVGAGGHGRELYSYVRDLMNAGRCLRFAGFVDEQKPSGGEILGGLGELSARLKAEPLNDLHYITAVGDNPARQALVKRIEALSAGGLAGKLSPWALLHPGAMVGHEIEIGEGACLAPGSVITTRVRIGRHAILNVRASVSHDCVVGEFVNLNPGCVICGNVTIGEGCYIGAGATVLNGVSIGPWTVVGAGAVVTKDLPGHVTAVGVPARIIKSQSSVPRPQP